MKNEELAELINGREYPFYLTFDEKKICKDAGLVVVYGASDDLMEFDGRFCDEYGCYEGGTVMVDVKGIIPSWDTMISNEDTEEAFEEYFKRKPRGREIEAQWDHGGYSWAYYTTIPHATFEIMEDGEKYCRGIVFNIEDL